jgi:hypothetical protein
MTADVHLLADEAKTSVWSSWTAEPLGGFTQTYLRGAYQLMRLSKKSCTDTREDSLR